MAEVALPEIRLPWHKQHERPSDAALIAHYIEPMPELIAAARAGIRGAADSASTADKPAAGALAETLAWHGLPWRWSWAYQLAGADHAAGRALAYLIPGVAAPVICVPLTYEMYEAMAKPVATTFIRQGITLAKEIGNHRWVEWAINQPAQLDDVLAVVRHKVGYLTKHPA